MRCFLALLPSDQTSRELYCHREALRVGYRSLKWIPPEKYHLTLFFWKEISPITAETLLTRINETLLSVPPFTVEFTGPGQLPPTGKPKVIIETLGEGAKTCRSIHRQLLPSVQTLAALEKHRFYPHVTLARMPQNYKTYPNQETVVSLSAVKGIMDKAVFYESRLRPEGAQHLPLFDWSLQNKEHT